MLILVNGKDGFKDYVTAKEKERTLELANGSTITFCSVSQKNAFIDMCLEKGTIIKEKK